MDTKLYVIGLPVHVTDRQLFDMFTPYGKVLAAKTIRIRRPMEAPLGIGIVEMSHREETEKALGAANWPILQGKGLFVFTGSAEVVKALKAAFLELARSPQPLPEELRLPHM